jgi:hypothetical protein
MLKKKNHYPDFDQLLCFHCLMTLQNKSNVSESLGKYTVWIGHIGFIILAVYAVIFATDRIFFADSAYYLFNIIEKGNFNIEHNRYSAIFTQAPVVMGVKYGWSLKALAITYSLTFILLYYLIFIITAHVFKTKDIAITLLFTLILMSRISFFHAVSEVHAAVAWSALYASAWVSPFLRQKKSLHSILRYGILFLSASLSVFSHPISIFILTYIILYFQAENQILYSRSTIYILLGVLSVYAIKMLTFKSISYENDQMSGILNFPDSFNTFKNYYSTRFFFIYHFKGFYAIPMILWISALPAQIFRRDYYKSFVSTFFPILFFIILCITFQNGDASYMMEKNFMALGVMFTLPFFRDLFAGFSSLNHTKTIVTAGIILYTIPHYNLIHSEVMLPREVFFDSIIKKHKAGYIPDKILMNENTVPIKYLPLWPLGVESLLYSAMKDPSKNITVYVPFQQNEKELVGVSGVFYAAPFRKPVPVNELNEKYFNISFNPYVIIPDSADTR